MVHELSTFVWIKFFIKLFFQLAPMHGGVHMMNRMITIIEKKPIFNFGSKIPSAIGTFIQGALIVIEQVRNEQQELGTKIHGDHKYYWNKTDLKTHAK